MNSIFLYSFNHGRHFSRVECPKRFCGSMVSNMRRHIGQCHKNLNDQLYDDMINAFKIINRNSEESKKLAEATTDQPLGHQRSRSNEDEELIRPQNKVNTRVKISCCICGYNTEYRYAHLRQKHKMDKDSQEYKDTLRRVSVWNSSFYLYFYDIYFCT